MAKKISQLVAASAAAAANEYEINEAGTSKKVTGAQVATYVRSAGAAFSANKNGTNQTGIAASTFTKLTFGTKAFDNGAAFDNTTNHRWTPPAGRVRMSATAQMSTGVVVGSVYAIALYKNSSLWKSNSIYATVAGDVYLSVTALDNANGTDFYEVFVLGAGAGTKDIVGNANATWFDGEQV